MGSLSGGGQSPPSTQTVEQKTEPWEGLQPHLRDLYTQAANWYFGRPTLDEAAWSAAAPDRLSIAMGDVTPTESFKEYPWGENPLFRSAPQPQVPGQAFDFSRFWGPGSMMGHGQPGQNPYMAAFGDQGRQPMGSRLGMSPLQRQYMLSALMRGRRG